MPSYDENAAFTTPGTTYRRVRYIGVCNPPVGVPRVEILEADALFVNSTKRHLDEGVGRIVVEFDNDQMNNLFPIRDPADGSAIPGQSMTGAELFQAIYSWCVDQQLTRDLSQP